MVLWYGMIYNTEWYACMRVHACANPLRDILPSIWSNCAESRLFEGLIYVEAFRIFFEDWNENKHLLMIVDAHLRISWRLVPDDTCIHMSSTGATLPVHKVIHELPQVDRAVHLPSNSVVKRLVLSPVRRLIWPILYNQFSGFSGFHTRQALIWAGCLSMQLSLLQNFAAIVGHHLSSQTSSKPAHAKLQQKALLSLYFTCPMFA